MPQLGPGYRATDDGMVFALLGAGYLLEQFAVGFDHFAAQIDGAGLFVSREARPRQGSASPSKPEAPASR